MVAVLSPGRRIPGVQVDAVAARDERRARRYAQRQGIPRAHRSYGALLDDPEIDAVYIPLPNSLHAPWSIRALRAGKHVLCEKPLADNAQSATEMACVAAETGAVLVEAFHYRYHPLAARIKTILDSGEIGQVRHMRAEFSVPLLQPRSIQYRYDLGGGAMMDVGCYAVNLLRFLAASEPEVISAEARLIRPQVDRWMQADLQFGNGCTARLTCALLSARLLRSGLVVQGTEGELSVTFPFLPHLFHCVLVRNRASIRHERLEGPSTYTYQLQAFVDAVRNGGPVLTHAADAIANMRTIDAIYQSAGLKPRGM